MRTGNATRRPPLGCPFFNLEKSQIAPANWARARDFTGRDDCDLESRFASSYLRAFLPVITALKKGGACGLRGMAPDFSRLM